MDDRNKILQYKYKGLGASDSAMLYYLGNGGIISDRIIDRLKLFHFGISQSETYSYYALRGLQREQEVFEYKIRETGHLWEFNKHLFNNELSDLVGVYCYSTIDVFSDDYTIEVKSSMKSTDEVLQLNDKQLLWQLWTLECNVKYVNHFLYHYREGPKMADIESFNEERIFRLRLDDRLEIFEDFRHYVIKGIEIFLNISI